MVEPLDDAALLVDQQHGGDGADAVGAEHALLAGSVERHRDLRRASVEHAVQNGAHLCGELGQRLEGVVVDGQDGEAAVGDIMLFRESILQLGDGGSVNGSLPFAESAGV